jgi:hypothetical protein
MAQVAALDFLHLEQTDPAVDTQFARLIVDRMFKLIGNKSDLVIKRTISQS